MHRSNRGGGGGARGGRPDRADVKKEGDRPAHVTRERSPIRGRDEGRGRGPPAFKGRGGGGGRGDDRRDRGPPRDRDRSGASDFPFMSGMGSSGGDHGRGDPDSGSTLQLQENPNKVKFTGRSRLFVGNLPKDMEEDEFKKLFLEFGEIGECFISEKSFGFVTMDSRANAETAKAKLDGQVIRSRTIRVRFATHNAAVRVKEIPAYVSNELLFHAFSMFGEVERAVHTVDDRGRPTGEGTVEFARRPGANDAIRRVTEGVFLLTTCPKPIVVEIVEPKDDEDGLQERMVPKNAQFTRERENAPRFARRDTFEFEFGNKWKTLYAAEKRKRDELEASLQADRERLIGEMDIAYQEYQAAILREDLKRRQAELERFEQTRMQRMEQMKRQQGRSTGPGTGTTGGHPFSGLGTYSNIGQQHNSQFQDFHSGDQKPLFGGGGGAKQDQKPNAFPPAFGQQQSYGQDGEALVSGVQKILQMVGGGGDHQAAHAQHAATGGYPGVSANMMIGNDMTSHGHGMFAQHGGGAQDLFNNTDLFNQNQAQAIFGAMPNQMGMHGAHGRGGHEQRHY